MGNRQRSKGQRRVIVITIMAIVINHSGIVISDSGQPRILITIKPESLITIDQKP